MILNYSASFVEIYAAISVTMITSLSFCKAITTSLCIILLIKSMQFNTHTTSRAFQNFVKKLSCKACLPFLQRRIQEYLLMESSNTCHCICWKSYWSRNRICFHKATGRYILIRYPAKYLLRVKKRKGKASLHTD